MQRKIMITVKDIAKALNLHHTTISRALRNHPDIKPETKELILKKVKIFLDVYNPPHKIITINAWNGWTEGSYLLPDTKTGNAYLKAIKKVFGEK